MADLSNIVKVFVKIRKVLFRPPDLLRQVCLQFRIQQFTLIDLPVIRNVTGRYYRSL